ncbi:hypothetical protein CVT25_011914 [Psilocybe cyanescens]|uniref:Uncharacterized protein n=1 Tax=Psilocybe cyanescens TaxID=93625 RepID=A0A409XQQ9_PSICY|nr:hypothetical protein CVT25_011914 [Psilocybe cyanescens]
MAGLTPPPNAVNVPLSPIPANPALLSDISNAHDDLNQLASPKDIGSPGAATDDEVGAVEAYIVGLVISDDPGGNDYVAPAWVANLTAKINQQFNQLTATIQQIHNQLQGSIKQLQGSIKQLQGSVDNLAADVAFICQRLIEQPVLLANNQVGAYSPLPNPVTIQANGLAQSLTVPNPTSREELN